MSGLTVNKVNGSHNDHELRAAIKHEQWNTTRPQCLWVRKFGLRSSVFGLI